MSRRREKECPLICPWIHRTLRSSGRGSPRAPPPDPTPSLPYSVKKRSYARGWRRNLLRPQAPHATSRYFGEMGANDKPMPGRHGGEQDEPEDFGDHGPTTLDPELQRRVLREAYPNTPDRELPTVYEGPPGKQVRPFPAPHLAATIMGYAGPNTPRPPGSAGEAATAFATGSNSAKAGPEASKPFNPFAAATPV